MKAKTTKRALLLSVLSLLVCVAMLIGTTYAWFTDSVTTGVNSITSGKLDVDVVDATGNSVTSLSFVNKDGSSNILWEPGATFKLDKAFKIINKGNLYLKYKVELTAFTGDTELLDVIDLTVNGQDWDSFWSAQIDKPLAPGADSGELNVQGKMSEEAGNEYMGKTLNAVKINVLATQQTAEFDSEDDQYDKDAEYPVVVNNATELKNALAAGENVKLADDITLIDNPLAVQKANEATIDLNGKKLSGVNTVAGTSALIKNNGTLNITGSGSIVVEAEHPDTDWYPEGFPTYASNTISNSGTLVIGDGVRIENKTAGGGASYAIDNYAGATLIINGGEIIQSGGDVAIRMNTASATAENNVTINGGTISGKRAIWIHLAGGSAATAPKVNLTINGGTLSGTQMAVYSYSYGNSFANTKVTITDGTFNGDVQFGGGYKGDKETVSITGGTFNGYLGRWLENDGWEDIAKP